MNHGRVFTRKKEEVVTKKEMEGYIPGRRKRG
jgi:hypothetical protein